MEPTPPIKANSTKKYFTKCQSDESLMASLRSAWLLPAGTFLIAVLAILSGCTTPVEEPSEIPPTPTIAAIPHMTPSAPVDLAPSGHSGNTSTSTTLIFSETLPLMSGARPLVIDPGEYGHPYFSPGHTYSLFVDSGMPVNILVLDSVFTDRITLFIPEYGILPSRAPDREVSFSHGFRYDCPLIVQEDYLVKKTINFSVPRFGKYVVVIDPRFNARTTWDLSGESSSHDFFRATIELMEYPAGRAVESFPGAVNEIVGLSTNYWGTPRIYALDDYGYPSLSEGDTIHLSVSTGRPVNILVLDGEAMDAFSRVDPVEVTVTNRTVDAVHRGYSYGEISPNNGEVFHEDLSLDTEAFVAIPAQSKYYVIIDPRFSSEFSSSGGYISGFEEDFVTAKVYIEVFREGSALYWKKMGDYSLRKGDYEAAESCYHKSLALDPENPDTWYNLGIVLRDLNKYHDAIEAFNQTLRIEPGDADVWEKMGILYLLTENEAAARDAYNRSLGG